MFYYFRSSIVLVFKMNGAVDANGAPKTLYVGNLDNGVTEDLILAVFNTIGSVKEGTIFKRKL